MGHEYQSPLRRWDVLAGLCESIGAKTFVEVGCKEGRTTSALLNAIPDLKVITIDPWAPVPNADEDYKNWDFVAIESEFWKNVGANKDRVDHWRMTSREASNEMNVAGQKYDVVFIDAGHDYESAFQDIHAFWWLVREGGYLCGHDYQHKFPGVMRAVADCFPLMRVAVMPDSVWVVQKDPGMQLQEAA